MCLCNFQNSFILLVFFCVTAAAERVVAFDVDVLFCRPVAKCIAPRNEFCGDKNFLALTDSVTNCTADGISKPELSFTVRVDTAKASVTIHSAIKSVMIFFISVLFCKCERYFPVTLSKSIKQTCGVIYRAKVSVTVAC